MDKKESKPVNPKEDQPWKLTGRTDVETEAPILWPPDVKSWLTGKDPEAGQDWGQEKRAAEDEMVGWHHWLNGHELGWTLGDGKGQGGLANTIYKCCLDLNSQMSLGKYLHETTGKIWILNRLCDDIKITVNNWGVRNTH